MDSWLIHSHSTGWVLQRTLLGAPAKQRDLVRGAPLRVLVAHMSLRCCTPCQWIGGQRRNMLKVNWMSWVFHNLSSWNRCFGSVQTNWLLIDPLSFWWNVFFFFVSGAIPLRFNQTKLCRLFGLHRCRYDKDIQRPQLKHCETTISAKALT